MRIHRLTFVLFAGFTGLTATAAAEAQTSSPSPAPAGASSADGTLTVAGEHLYPLHDPRPSAHSAPGAFSRA